MEYDVLRALLLNVMSMISFLYILGRIRPIFHEHKKRLLNVLPYSLFTAFLSIFCMVFPIYKSSSFMFDLRSNLIVILGMCTGFIPALLSAAISGLYRVIAIGGSSSYYGIMYGTIIPALMGGTYYWLMRLKRKKVSYSRNLNGLSLIMMSMLLWAKDFITFEYIIPGGAEMIDKVGIYLPIAHFLSFIIAGAIIRDNLRQYQHQYNLKEEAVTDELTKLKNYRFIANNVYNLIEEEGRKYRHISFVMIDLDRFKAYNDTYGHLEGNKALKYVAKILLESVREGDIVTRYGGEEFLIILRGVGVKGAYKIAERIRRNVSGLGSILGSTGHRRNVTISVGISAYPANGSNTHELIEKADRALYKAKEMGRNNVQIYSSPDNDEDRYNQRMAADKL